MKNLLIYVTLNRVLGSALNSSSCANRSRRLSTHEDNVRMLAYANLAHAKGICSIVNEFMMASIWSLIDSDPSKPCFNSMRLLMIVTHKMFIYSSSMISTFCQGFLSLPTVSFTSSTFYRLPGNFSSSPIPTLSIIVFSLSSITFPPPPPPPSSFSSPPSSPPSASPPRGRISIRLPNRALHRSVL